MAVPIRDQIAPSVSIKRTITQSGAALKWHRAVLVHFARRPLLGAKGMYYSSVLNLSVGKPLAESKGERGWERNRIGQLPAR